jgi:cardiolipin synthase
MNPWSESMAATSSPHSLIVEPTDGKAAILAGLASATTTVDVTIYELSDSEVIAALIAAQGRNVTVRVLYNWYSFNTDVQATEVTPFVKQLTNAGVACRPAPREFEVTHEKALVVDGAVAFILTLNLVEEYFQSTRDFGIVSTVAGEVAEVASVFAADWSSAAANPSVASLVWSPTNSRSRLTAVIGDATKTLEIYNEEVSDPEILGALVAAAGRGVAVRVIAAVLTEDGSDSGPNENAPGINYLNAHGVRATCKAFPVSTPDGSVPIYIHAKVIVADFGSGDAKAFVGSENFSCVSLDDNRECGIIVTESAVLARLEATFEADWAQPSVTVGPDSTPLQACPVDAVARTRTRVASRPPTRTPPSP